MLVMKETLRGGGLNFVKDVNMTCVNLITNIIVVAEEKRRHYLHTTPRIYFILYSSSDPFS